MKTEGVGMTPASQKAKREAGCSSTIGSWEEEEREPELTCGCRISLLAKGTACAPMSRCFSGRERRLRIFYQAKKRKRCYVRHAVALEVYHVYTYAYRTTGREAHRQAVRWGGGRESEKNKGTSRRRESVHTHTHTYTQSERERAWEAVVRGRIQEKKWNRETSYRREDEVNNTRPKKGD